MGAQTRSERRPEQKKPNKPRGPQHMPCSRRKGWATFKGDVSNSPGGPPTSPHRLQREPRLTCSHGDGSALRTQGVEVNLCLSK